MNELIWVEKNMELEKIIDEKYILNISWDKNPSKDFDKFSKNYRTAGFLVLEHIIEVNHCSNFKYDYWFPVSVYLMRQSIELLMKSAIIKNFKTQNSQEKLKENQHDIFKLFILLKDEKNTTNLTFKEIEWLEQYLKSVVCEDPSSDLFRYPYKANLYKKYHEKAFDIVHIGNCLLYGYSTLYKFIYGEWFENEKLNTKESPQFLKTTSILSRNCYIHEPLSHLVAQANIADCYWQLQKEIAKYWPLAEGYSEVARYLFEKTLNSNTSELFFPITFLMRHAIELCLKGLVLMEIPSDSDYNRIKNSLKTHNHKKLWKKFNSTLEEFSSITNKDIEDFHRCRDYIEIISSKDTSGNNFRYPCSLDFNYDLQLKKIDQKNFFHYLLGIYNFLSACKDWLESQSLH